MILLDSSFILAFFNELSPMHEQAVESMRRFERDKKKVVINEIVLGDVITSMAKVAGLEHAKLFARYASANYHVQTNTLEDFEGIIKIFEHQKHQISYSDASVVFLAMFLQCPVATYNENIRKEIGSYSAV